MTATTIEGHGAVVEAAGASIRIEPILIEPPGPGEVRVRLVASGVCHSDHWAIRNGNWGAPFPMLLGHEGAGVIQDAGEGVQGMAPGDRVLLAWGVPCGVCRTCVRGAPRKCAHAWSQPSRLSRAGSGERLEGTLSLGTLATHTVVHAAQVIAVPDDADLSRVCLLGCGVSTGVGAALNTGRVWSGSTVAVVGLGGIGLAALQGARIAGAARLIAVDLVAAKLDLARSLGATDVVDASRGDAAAVVRGLTGGVGVDVAIEATGVPSVVGQVMAMLGSAGVGVAIGVPPPDSEVTLQWSGGPGAVYPNKSSLLVSDGGDALPKDFVTWLGWAVDGSLELDAIVSREASLTAEDIDEAFRAMLAGEVVRTVIRIGS
ncbi:MAG: S-(hydroxymethyl)mycothiol dehydrogenase [Actinomycetota bacterium]|nr:S-(hydroxymethyl)mycothiol dehydrogenase [Actinomycetota bacterium]